MDNYIAQAADVDFVKKKLIALQHEKAHGHLRACLQDGRIELVEVLLTFHPPGRKERSGGHGR